MASSSLARFEAQRQRTRSFATVLYPSQDVIEICPDFKAAWMHELEKQPTGWVSLPNGKKCQVWLCISDSQCHMVSGRVVSREFGFGRPAHVFLDYQVDDNLFLMDIVKFENEVIILSDDSVEVSSVVSDLDCLDSVVDSSGENLSCVSKNEIHDFVDDRLCGWKLTVKANYMDTKKTQVLHLPPATSQYVLRGKRFVVIKGACKLSGVKCTIATGKTRRKPRPRFLTHGWYEWVRANDLGEGDELLFQIEFPFDVVYVKIVRAKKRQ